MIWHRGEILPDDALTIPIADRTFEHGLGLFETLRTWDGRPTLLDRHLARILRSARELGLHLDPASLPDPRAIARLIEADGGDGDRMLRITATGGVGPGPSTVWMRSGPLPPDHAGFTIWIGEWDVTSSDPMARHKSLNYWSRRLAFEQARAEGADERLGEAAGRLWEGSRTNLFIVRGGEISTPSLRGPIVPGVMRGLVLEVAGEGSTPIREVEGIAIDELRSADEVFLTNAVRGVVPVSSARSRHESPVEWFASGPITRDLSARALARLRRGDEIR